MPPGLGAEIKAQSRKLPVPSPGVWPAPLRYGRSDRDGDRLRGVVTSLLVWLKSCQRLGYFPRPGEIPGVVAGHNGAGGSVVTGTLNWGFPVPVG